MPTARLSVRGIKPVPWGNNEWDWRQAIADEARRVPRPSASPESRFSVQITFLMTEANINRPNLDNLSKPVLNTLFLSRHAQVKKRSLTGALFTADDDRVFKLILEKREVFLAREEGIDVQISW